MTQHSERAHALLGASSMSRWEKCPASLRLAARFPNVESDFAKEGTLAHEIAEWHLEHGYRMAATAAALSGKFGELPDDMLEAIQVYLDAVWEAYDAGSRNELSIEERFSLDGAIPGATDMFGTNDASVYNPDTRTLTILDYKHGAGVGVEVEDNPQLLYYALGAAMKKHNRGLVTVELVVVQPRFDHPDGPVRKWTVGAADLLAFRERLMEAADRARDPNAPFQPGKHCRFCPAAGACRAQTKPIFDMLRKMGWSINEDTGEMFLPDDETYTPDQLLGFYEHRDQLKAWMNRRDDQMHRLAMEGEFAGKLKFVAGRKTRAWKDPDAAYRVMARTGIDEDELYESKVISPAKAEKLLKKVDADILTELADLTETTTGAPILVPDADKRQAITVGAAADFEIIE